jgi:predicted GTPase
MESNSVLSKPSDGPCLTIVIKGLINSGKSTLFNAIFSRNMSKTSIKRQTMCQTVLTEANHTTTNYEEIYAAISDVNKKVYESTEAGHDIKNITEIERAIAPVEGFLRRVQGIKYRYVETGNIFYAEL